ncbi:bifunctional (p)ppGpp synthetase/guanosine-3',5'-bis(diphosphate) 3'-pyrophosphohydrolase [Candidatus Peribacteria bacterium]|nr:bifunctional (p)ppGpp synthetase/guanosine-3',5'-bis(diphosphate) 3'-pyrophosphohydrolase [Candidatus Peribacteria bacterium]
MAQCCHPAYPEDIVAVLRTGGKCMVHAIHCKSLDRVNPNRLLPAYWQTGEKGKVVSFALLFHDVPGLLTRVTRIFYEMGMNIIDLTVVAQNDGTARIHVSLEIPDNDVSFLDRLLARLRLDIPEFLMQEDDFFDKKK